MKVLHTVIAFVILGALGGVFYYLQKQPASEPVGSVPKKKLFSFTADQVDEFAIEMPNQPASTFRRVTTAPPPKTGAESKTPEAPAPQWQITSPEGIAADSMLIQAFLDELPKLEYTPLDGETTPTLAEYGLDQPQKVLRFKTKQGQAVTLSIGKDNPSGYAKYGKFDSAAGVFLLDSIDAKPLEKTLFDLRDKRALPIVMDKAQRLELRFDFRGQQASSEELTKAKELGLPTKPAQIAMTKLANGNWNLTQPAARTDHGSSNYFVTILTGALMKSVEEENPKSLARYGLDRPAIRLNVTTPEGSYSLLVGSKKTGDDVGYYAKNSVWPHVFTINQSVYDQLNQDLDGYRNRYLFDFQTTNARRVEILGPEGEMRFDRKGEEWFRGDKKVEASKVEVFLNSIHALRIQRYSTDAPGRYAGFGLAKPWLKVKVTFGEDNKEETVLFSLRDKRFYAAREGEPSVYEMAPNEPENLQPKLKDLAS